MNVKKTNHVTISCPGNAFQTGAFDQSDAQNSLRSANQLPASEDLNLARWKLRTVLHYDYSPVC